jgi:hypothetical protein
MSNVELVQRVTVEIPAQPPEPTRGAWRTLLKILQEAPKVAGSPGGPVWPSAS